MTSYVSIVLQVQDLGGSESVLYVLNSDLEGKGACFTKTLLFYLLDVSVSLFLFVSFFMPLYTATLLFVVNYSLHCFSDTLVKFVIKFSS